jgi:hypothetical protein
MMGKPLCASKADESASRKKLRVEDEKGFQLDLGALEAAKAGAGADAEDVVAGVGKAGAQLLGGRRRLRLLLHAAALVGQFDDELRHDSARRVRRSGYSG